jgi:ketosteroid isomerase-like protein
MSTNNADLIRRAYQAYASGDLTGMLEFVDPDL